MATVYRLPNGKDARIVHDPMMQKLLEDLLQILKFLNGETSAN